MTFQVDSPGTVLISTLLDILALDILALDILGLDILGRFCSDHYAILRLDSQVWTFPSSYRLS